MTLAARPTARRLVVGRRRAPVLFSFDGASGTWPGMARELFAAEPAFRASIEATSPIAARAAGFDALGAFTLPEAPAAAKRDQLVVLGLIQIAQCDLWHSVGLEPDAVLAISIGEAAAAYAAGALSREEAVAGGLVQTQEVMTETDVGAAGTQPILQLRPEAVLDDIQHLLPDGLDVHP